MAIVAIVIAVIAMAIAVGIRFAPDRSSSSSSWVDGVTRRRVLVHTTEDSTFDGVLVAVEPTMLVLADAKNLDRDNPIELAGQQWIDRDRVHFVQVVDT